ncbi:unnamed protein product, partial [Cyprideis torosa]
MRRKRNQSEYAITDGASIAGGYPGGGRLTAGGLHFDFIKEQQQLLQYQHHNGCNNNHVGSMHHPSSASDHYYELPQLHVTATSEGTGATATTGLLTRAPDTNSSTGSTVETTASFGQPSPQSPGEFLEGTAFSVSQSGLQVTLGNSQRVVRLGEETIGTPVYTQIDATMGHIMMDSL